MVTLTVLRDLDQIAQVQRQTVGDVAFEAADDCQTDQETVH